MLLGYKTIMRGISTRSNERGVSHLLVWLGPDYSIESVVQALGRGTGNFRSKLQRTGQSCVKVLAAKADLELAAT